MPHSRYETEREKNLQLVSEFTDKSFKTSHELDKLSDEHSKCLKECDELKMRITSIQAEKEALQKKLTKEVCFIFILDKLHSTFSKCIA